MAKRREKIPSESTFCCLHLHRHFGLTIPYEGPIIGSFPSGTSHNLVMTSGLVTTHNL